MGRKGASDDVQSINNTESGMTRTVRKSKRERQKSGKHKGVHHAGANKASVQKERKSENESAGIRSSIHFFCRNHGFENSIDWRDPNLS